jgi:hypothetical protein
MDPDAWAALYRDEGTLLQPGMERPISKAEVPGHVARINSVLPGIRCEMKNWASDGNTVFTEWTMHAELFGEPLQWDGADRFTLVDGLVAEEVVHFDALPLWARLEPQLQREGFMPELGSREGHQSFPPILSAPVAPCPPSDPERFMQGYADLWRTADASLIEEVYHPLWKGRSPTVGHRTIRRDHLPAYCEQTKAALPDYTLQPIRWAARDNVLFIEWFVSGTLAGESVRWEGIDRQTLCGAQAVEGVSYFDSLPLWARLDPTMKRGFLLSHVADALAAASSSSEPTNGT